MADWSNPLNKSADILLSALIYHPRSPAKNIIDMSLETIVKFIGLLANRA